MRFNWNKESSILLILSLFILIGGSYYGHQLLVQPARETANSSSRILSNQDTLLKQVDSLNLSQQSLLNQLDTLNASLPVSNNSSKWLANIKKLADNNNLVIYLFNAVESTSDNEEVENVETHSYQLEVEYENVNELDKFVKEIYELTQKTDITSISYETGQNLSFKATIFLNTYNQTSDLTE
ncbi:hypothetical protein ACEN32_01440 [Marinilactibacillus psychrotolerans]|uniref:hypothetical protein n=1 Tax=Marinilactibacillus psychrotolerans TaxID=191770 RepID=UPI003884CB5A